MTPLSFCMITTFYPPYHFGGEAMYVYRLVNALAERGHRATVVHCVDAFRTLTEAEPRGGAFPHHPNVTVHRLESRARLLAPVSPLVTYLSGTPGLKNAALEKILSAERFDVVHFHLVTLFGPGVIEHAPAGAVRLYTMHDHWLVCPMYDLWRYDRELCETPTCIRCQASFRRPPQLWRHTGLLDRVLPQVDMFLAPSRSVIDQHHRRGFAYPIRQLPLFLPATAAAETTPRDPAGQPSPDRPYFLFAGRLVKLKGVQTLIEAFRSFTGADLLIAGDGDYEATLRKLAGDVPHVRFLGRVHPDDLRALYRDAVATLVPSLVYETFGFVVLESLAQGTPVIATELGAVGELTRDSCGGLTYRDRDELIAAMELLLADDTTRAELGERGQRAVAERWSEDRHLESYFGLIDEARERRAEHPSLPVSA